jgi:hypothetical protein
MRRLPRIALTFALLASAGIGTAQGGIVFTPHLSEYARLPPGQYTEFTFIYDRHGNKVELGLPFVPAGASTDAALALMKFLWVGNIFRDTNVPILNTHPQFCRLIGGFGYQQNTEQIANRVRLFGHRPGANGLMDLFGLCGIYGDEHQWGPLRWNGLLASTVKFPVGRYDTDAALNTGTNYWSYIPQLAFHADLWGRIIIDGTLAWQFNENNDKPSFGGTTPTRIADWRNAEINVAWKFNEHWYADVGYSFRESVGPNYYDQLTVNFKDQPVAPDTLCAQLGLSRSQCDSPLLDQFYVKPRPGPYADNGIEGTMLTAGIYYVYRTSSVLQLRVAKPISGRGSQIDAIYDVYTRDPRSNPDANPVSSLTTTLYGVQEAAAVSASPYLELRFVYLFWAP